MAPITRSISKEICTFLIETMLDGEDATLYQDSLEYIGVLTLEDLLTLPEEDIDVMQRVEKDNKMVTMTTMSQGHKRLVTWLVKWLNYKKPMLNICDSDAWLSLTVDEFDTFRTTYGNSADVPSNTNVQSTESRAVLEKKQELDLFKRSIKRDATLYPVLKEDKDWDVWNRSITSLARTHDVIEVLDSSYKPNDDTSKALFDIKQSFMYSVFNKVVITDIGKTIVRKHERMYDAQAVYAELTDYAKTSTAANINIENII